jgi:GMP synthase (glutamine-hydrolysing)
VPERLDLHEAAGLVVMGGPMNADETEHYPFLAREVTWLQQSVEAGLPVLGICLGSQLLAKSLGARVYRNQVKEIGWYTIELTDNAADDALFADCEPRPTVFQWHGDTFDLPAGAVQLARSDLCEVQAFRFGAHAYGLQFHVEMTADMVDDWLAEPTNQDELAALECVDPQAIRADTSRALARMRALGDRVLQRFARMCRERA